MCKQRASKMTQKHAQGHAKTQVIWGRAILRLLLRNIFLSFLAQRSEIYSETWCEKCFLWGLFHRQMPTLGSKLLLQCHCNGSPSCKAQLGIQASPSRGGCCSSPFWGDESQFPRGDVVEACCLPTRSAIVLSWKTTDLVHSSSEHALHSSVVQGEVNEDTFTSLGIYKGRQKKNPQ